MTLAATDVDFSRKVLLAEEPSMLAFSMVEDIDKIEASDNCIFVLRTDQPLGLRDIESFHIYVQNGGMNGKIRDLYSKCIRRCIPVYMYTDRAAWLQLKTEDSIVTVSFCSEKQYKAATGEDDLVSGFFGELMELMRFSVSKDQTDTSQLSNGARKLFKSLMTTKGSRHGYIQISTQLDKALAAVDTNDMDDPNSRSAQAFLNMLGEHSLSIYSLPKQLYLAMKNKGL